MTCRLVEFFNHKELDFFALLISSRNSAPVKVYHRRESTFLGGRVGGEGDPLLGGGGGEGELLFRLLACLLETAR